MKRWLLFASLLTTSMSYAAKVPLVSHSHVYGTVAANQTVYIPVGDTVISSSTVEAHQQVPFYKAGTFSGMYVRLETNSLTGYCTFYLRINGVRGNSFVALAPGVKIGTDTTHTDTIVSGDLVNYELVTGAGTSILPVANLINFAPDDGSYYQRFSPAAPAGGYVLTNGYQPYYSNITGIMGQNFYDHHTYHIMRTSGTFRNFAVYASTNARINPTHLYLYKNGANSGLTITIQDGQWGLIENTTSTVNVVVGDTVSIKMDGVDGADSRVINFRLFSMEFINNTGLIEWSLGTDDKPQNAGDTYTMPMKSALTFGGDEYLLQANSTGTLSNFCVYITQNNVSTISTVKVRKNGVTDASVVMTIPASSTGTFCDNTNFVTFVSTDTLGYIGDSPSGTGTLYYASIMAKASVSQSARGPSDSMGSIQIFPTNNIWNTRIDNAPLHANNAQWMDSINGHTEHEFHPDFGTTYLGRWNGIPYNLINNNTPKVIVTWAQDYNYSDESDAIPVDGLPIPADAICESDPPPLDDNSDRHCILINTESNTLYETFGSSRIYSGGVWQSSWTIRQLSIWDLTSNALRTDTWTSADAAGLPILPGLVRWEEVQNGSINHALRFTLDLTHGPYLWPARHDANSGGVLNPPFGMRVRLKSDYDISGFSATNQIILTALKQYGMFMADNGGDWFLSGAPNPNWDNSDLGLLETIIPIDAFEVVDTSTWIVDADSGEANAPTSANPYNSRITGRSIFSRRVAVR